MLIFDDYNHQPIVPRRDRSNEIRKIAKKVAYRIPPIDVERINWERRIECKHSFKKFCETYLKSSFYMNWSKDQLKVIEFLEKTCKEGGMYALAMPRGGGKTTLVRAAILWVALYGHKRYVVNIGSKIDMAVQGISYIKSQLHNELLRADFPEIWDVLEKVDNNRYFQLRGSYNDHPIWVQRLNNLIVLPAICLGKGNKDNKAVEMKIGKMPIEVHPDEYGVVPPENYEASVYYKHDSDSVRYIPSANIWLAKNAGIVIKAFGIGSAIRGESMPNPITMEQIRPDLVLLDDVQKDIIASNQVSCENLVNLIDSAVMGLSGPGKRISAIMPCTVIRKGDVSSVFLDRELKPEWNGHIFKMVEQWPAGITDFEISNATEAGKLWLQYKDLRQQSLREFGDIRLATEFYSQNREKMDEGFVVSWEDRYDPSFEISAIQHAMNLRFSLKEGFLSEYQNLGRGSGLMVGNQLKVADLVKKQTNLPRGSITPDWKFITAYVDVQSEALYYVVYACDDSYTGSVIDYGTWPEIPFNNFNKAQLEKWRPISTMYLQDNQNTPYAGMDRRGNLQINLESRIYYALSKLIPILKNKEYSFKINNNIMKSKINRIGIDVRWGKVNDVIKRWFMENKPSDVILAYGQGIMPSQRQLEEYERRPGWLFEHQLSPDVKEPKWVIKPGNDGLWYLMMDVNRLKDFLMERLASPPGSAGSISLFADKEENHWMFCEQICDSEYPETRSARGLFKNVWEKRNDGPDNDYLDCLVGCIALAGTMGVVLKVSDNYAKKEVVTRKWSDYRAMKQLHRTA